MSTASLRTASNGCPAGSTSALTCQSKGTRPRRPGWLRWPLLEGRAVPGRVGRGRGHPLRAWDAARSTEGGSRRTRPRTAMARRGGATGAQENFDQSRFDSMFHVKRRQEVRAAPGVWRGLPAHRNQQPGTWPVDEGVERSARTTGMSARWVQRHARALGCSGGHRAGSGCSPLCPEVVLGDLKLEAAHGRQARARGRAASGSRTSPTVGRGRRDPARVLGGRSEMLSVAPRRAGQERVV